MTCAECGQETLAGAPYCRACGAALNGAPPRVPCSLEVAIDLVLGGEEGIGPGEEDFAETVGPVGVPDLDFGEEEEEESAIDVAVPPPPPAPAAPPPPAPPPPPPPAEEVAIAEPEPEAAAEEQLFEPAAVEEDVAFAPPPPPPAPDEIALHDEESRVEDEGPSFAPPAAEPSFAPPAPEGEEVEIAELDFELEEEPPAPPADRAAEGDEEKKDEGENLGGWVIDFDKE